MMAMQEETQLLYQKYGISPMGSCVQMLIQMPILFALYRVFYNIPAYLSGVKGSFTGLVDSIQQTSGYQDTLVSLMEKYNVVTSSGLNASNVASKLADASGDTLSNYIIDILYKLPSKGWDALLDGKFFDGIQSAVEKTHDALLHFNYFLGLNISDTPWYIIKSNFTDKPDKWLLFVILALLIPVLSYLTQMINIKLMPQATNGNDQMASQMKMMNLMMPLMSLFFCFTVPVGLGIYWICSALVRGIQQFFVNRHIENLDLEAVMAKNEEKAKNKRKKMGLSEDYIKKAAQIKTKSIDSKANVSASADTEEKLAKAAEYKANAKAGSLASKANMVKEFNERNSRKYVEKIVEYIEVSAKTIDDALTEASIKLGTTSDKLEYEVIDKGSNGFLGIGSRDAVIKVKKAEASVEDEIREFLDSVFKAMKLEVTIDIKVDEDNRNVDVELNGPEMGVLIGKRGQTLDSLQYLTNLAINKQSENYYRVKIDTEDYRKRRRETLENLAKNISFKVKRTKRPVSLEPMNPFERRVIHSALQNDRFVETHSEGDEPYRHVVVTLKK